MTHFWCVEKTLLARHAWLLRPFQSNLCRERHETALQRGVKTYSAPVPVIVCISVFIGEVLVLVNDYEVISLFETTIERREVTIIIFIGF